MLIGDKLYNDCDDLSHFNLNRLNAASRAQLPLSALRTGSRRATSLIPALVNVHLAVSMCADLLYVGSRRRVRKELWRRQLAHGGLKKRRLW